MSDAAAVDIDLETIKRMIPHRDPFLMIDRVVDMVANARATGMKTIHPDEPCFKGHFPDMPIWPGVYTVEAMAQTAAVLVNHSLNLIDVPINIYLMRVDNARFRQQVLPGNILELHMTLRRGHGKVWRIDGRAIVADREVASADIVAMWERQSDSS
ncbi:MAG: 3-hydroxyacyl-ACP dehydratase FabZ [Rhodobacteraceae bacterium]|nr:3-hydroxyacyl-ACP dehydratase FabZ [Paracoccaceae bacterium]